jgi:hypothetical protein
MLPSSTRLFISVQTLLQVSGPPISQLAVAAVAAPVQEEEEQVEAAVAPVLSK